MGTAITAASAERFALGVLRLNKAATALAMGLALCAPAGAGYLVFSLWSRDRGPPAAASISGGGEVLRFPGSYLRVGARSHADARTIELAVFFPGFMPAGQFNDVTAHTDLNDRFERVVSMTVKPADGEIDPADRPARLYQRFLEDVSLPQPGGLIARAFQSGSPFEGDDLYYTSPEGRQFAARCRRPDPIHRTPSTCVAAFRSGELDVEVRLAAAWLSEWSKLMTGARGLIEAARQ